jgi:hypothetical protein
VLPAFFIDRDAKFTLLFSHGNAEDLGMIIQYFRNWSASVGPYKTTPGAMVMVLPARSNDTM